MTVGWVGRFGGGGSGVGVLAAAGGSGGVRVVGGRIGRRWRVGVRIGQVILDWRGEGSVGDMAAWFRKVGW